MKTLVLYRSKSGFVKKYAEWIAEDLSADIFEASAVDSSIFEPYDTVIFGGGLYVSGINGIKFITKNLHKLTGKKIIVFSSGASPAREEAINEVRNMNFTPEQQQQIKFFYMRGGFDYNKLTPIDKVLMNLLKWKIKRTKKSTLVPDEKGMLAAYDVPMDFTRKKNIEALINYATLQASKRNIQLKKACIEDAENLHQMQIKAFMPLLQKYKDYDTNPGNETLDRIISRLNQSFTDYYIIMLEDKTVGGIRIVRLQNGARCRISPIFVLPEYQGLGIAQETLRLVEAIYSPVEGWELDTILQEEGNCYLYEKAGYKQTGETKVINDKMTLVYYRK